MRLTTLFLTCGGVIVAGAIAWWWTTFSYVIGYGYLSWPEAGRCLVHDSDNCALARALLIAGQDPGKVVEVKPNLITRDALEKNDIRTVFICVDGVSIRWCRA